MKAEQIIQAAIPNASSELCEHIVWGRTPFPMRPVDARELYKAASRLRRAEANGLRLCMFCDNTAVDGKWECQKCRAALDRSRAKMEDL